MTQRLQNAGFSAAFSGEFGFEVGELDPEITFIGRNKAEHGGTVYPQHEQISPDYRVMLVVWQ